MTGPDTSPQMPTSPPPSSSHPKSPSLNLPWMQALIRAGAQLTRPDVAMAEAAGSAKDAVHYVLCGSGPGTVEAGADFLTAVAKARRLVATGARRVVFLTFGDTKDGRLHLSLISFAHHARRALVTNPAEFAVVPIRRPRVLDASTDPQAEAMSALRNPCQIANVWDSRQQA
ncbi:hypothetical protein [Pseudotabrizicola algicola]|uniref:Uncharacterized protein n=1 Tax=Pseudotabrizicola algicola TaxID=2709381 RepID=A0A6B3RJM4_9RHOB|nr:hypothetical protein [Pseudotabrizicola algicola]NEX45651.1 hypothetical protein [Pseudotabrizicola algicola]